MMTSSSEPKPLIWHKSSYSGNAGNCVEVAHPPTGFIWRKSSYSGNGGDCVEVAQPSTGILVRDSKSPNGSTLVFATPQWRAFLTTIATH